MSDQFSVASEASLEMRKCRAKLRQDARTGRATFSEVLVSRAGDLGPTTMTEVVGWGWPRMGPVKQIRVGQLAAREGLNMVMPVRRASWGSRQKLAEVMWSVSGDSSKVTMVEVAPESAVAEDVDRLGLLLARAENERDEALKRCELLEGQLACGQFAMPTVQAERLLAELADAVEEHKRGLSDGAPDFADADRRLWELKDRILVSGAPRKLVAA